MIDKFCEYLTNKIRKEMPEITDERAEVIMYGIQLIVGELPKIFSVFIIGAILGLWWQTLLSFFLLMPYKAVSGGFHLKTHIGCFLGTVITYCGIAMLSTYIVMIDTVKISLIIIILITGIIMVGKYAPADTINLPILRKKERTIKKTLSYIFLFLNMIIAYFVQNPVISNIVILGTAIQTFSITRLAYILTKNEYGYEVYKKQENIA